MHKQIAEKRKEAKGKRKRKDIPVRGNIVICAIIALV